MSGASKREDTAAGRVQPENLGDWSPTQGCGDLRGR